MIRILDAIEGMLEEGHFQDATVQQIVRKADCSVGSFYARFPDKETAFRSYYDRLCLRYEALSAEYLSPVKNRSAKLGAIIRRFVSFLVKSHRKNLGLFTAGSRYVASTRDDWSWNRSRKVNEHIARRLETLLVQRRAEIRHPRPKLAVRFVVLQLSGILRGAIYLNAQGTSRAPSDKVLVAELTRTVLSYLGAKEETMQTRKQDS
jgi:AcrR family transcriptional regulator